MTKNVYSVGQVNTYIKGMFDQDFMLNKISIRGEVSNYKYHTASGHTYFTLKDESGTIRGVLYARDRAGLSFPMRDGDKVVATGRVTIYAKSSCYELCATEIERDGAGDLYLRFEALKRELEEMGMFADEYKRPIPHYARRIGIVTAPTGAAVQDIKNVAARRNPFVQLILYPALVQGVGAVESIVKGIGALEQLNVDVIIVGRGGGSIEDLWAFNEEAVARAIFDCSVPVISAVGHQTDYTIADFVADYRAPTPSAAAEIAVFDYVQTVGKLREMRTRMDLAMKRQFEQARTRLERQGMRLRYLSPKSRLDEKRRWLMDCEDALHARMKSRLKESQHRLALYGERLKSRSPLTRLGAGYAYVSAQGRALTSISQTGAGEELVIDLMDGQITARVLGTNRREQITGGDL